MPDSAPQAPRRAGGAAAPPRYVARIVVGRSPAASAERATRLFSSPPTGDGQPSQPNSETLPTARAHPGRLPWNPPPLVRPTLLEAWQLPRKSLLAKS
ncbi:hypothetical protein PJP10_14325 [Mycobacterium kansasii]